MENTWKKGIIRRIADLISSLAEDHYTHPDKVARLHSAMLDIEHAIAERMEKLRKEQKEEKNETPTCPAP